MRGECDFSHSKSGNGYLSYAKPVLVNVQLRLTYLVFVLNFSIFYHQRYIRPIKDHVVSNVEFTFNYGKSTRIFQFFNATAKMTQPVARKVLGMVDLPALTVPNLHQQLVQIGYKTDRT